MELMKRMMVVCLTAVVFAGCGKQAGLSGSALKQAEEKAKADDPAQTGVYPKESGAGKSAKK